MTPAEVFILRLLEGITVIAALVAFAAVVREIWLRRVRRDDREVARIAARLRRDALRGPPYGDRPEILGMRGSRLWDRAEREAKRHKTTARASR